MDPGRDDRRPDPGTCLVHALGWLAVSLLIWAAIYYVVWRLWQ